jgi:Aerobic-type carbon monoxide dehydrogenase, small subunit CoxS/CutS homologs
MNIGLNINGEFKDINIIPGEMLCDVLRKLGFLSVRKACGTACCGTCTVLLDGKPIPSCSYLAAKTDGHNITTIEGLMDEAKILAGVLNNEGAVQCGYCSPGFALTVIAMKKELINPSDGDIDNYLNGNLCRCSGYKAQMRAVKKYLGVSE